MISQTAGSNANEIVKEVDALMAEISKDLPKGLVLTDLMSTKDFLDASVHEVVKTLIEAIILVVLVVYFFLQSVRSTIIPSISIIVSLVGTFAFLYVAGFSLNLLTLFALVLVIGTVVDDAIVVVEAVWTICRSTPRISLRPSTSVLKFPWPTPLLIRSSRSIW